VRARCSLFSGKSAPRPDHGETSTLFLQMSALCIFLPLSPATLISTPRAMQIYKTSHFKISLHKFREQVRCDSAGGGWCVIAAVQGAAPPFRAKGLMSSHQDGEGWVQGLARARGAHRRAASPCHPPREALLIQKTLIW